MFKTQKPSGAESDEAKVLVDDIGVPAGSYDRNSAADGDRSVRKVKAKAYFLCFCFYNFCCCLPERLVGPSCRPIEMTRDRWLGFMHFCCFLIHCSMAVASFYVGAGKDMEVAIYRTKPTWNNTGPNGYEYEVVKDFDLRIDTVTGLFFALSAFFHGIWVGASIFCTRNVWRYMTSYIDHCFCPWRFVEYSLSASLMLVAIGMISGLRDGATMLGIFALSFTTMLCGILTEVHSRPESPEKWAGDPDPVEWKDFNYSAFVAKFRSYTWRMAPHFVGWVPYVVAWFLVLSNFYRQIADLPQELQDRIPWFVPVAINGTVATFSSFTFVQWRYQWTKPEMYWKTELWYGILSATAKLYLGGLLFWNVLLADSFDEAITTASNSR